MLIIISRQKERKIKVVEKCREKMRRNNWGGEGKEERNDAERKERKRNAQRFRYLKKLKSHQTVCVKFEIVGKKCNTTVCCKVNVFSLSQNPWISLTFFPLFVRRFNSLPPLHFTEVSHAIRVRSHDLGQIPSFLLFFVQLIAKSECSVIYGREM